MSGQPAHSTECVHSISVFGISPAFNVRRTGPDKTPPPDPSALVLSPSPCGSSIPAPEAIPGELTGALVQRRRCKAERVELFVCRASAFRARRGGGAGGP